jgi:hypothetical protein
MLFVLLWVTLPGIAIAQVSPDEWGLHRTWGKRSLDLRPDVKGGVFTAEWKDVNPAPGKFDFSVFDGELSRVNSIGKVVMLAVRGKFKPDFLFNEVPYHPEQLSRGVHDPKGTLQFWHPNYEKRFIELLTAFAAYLEKSPNSSAVYSIRQTVNALGTEDSWLDPAKRSEDQWIVPEGVSFVPYSDEEKLAYNKLVSQTYYDLFASDYLLFVRSTLMEKNVPPVVLRAIEEGRVGLLHTSSRPEPLDRNVERKYKLHKKYGRDGATPVYTEAYSTAFRGDQLPAQWTYWRILSDLHVGVTFVAVYGSDIENGTDMEFQSAFDFANKYAGYQTGSAASMSPGGWVALREGGQYLQGDYSFLMSRMTGDANVALTGVGPDWQKYGMWARKISTGGRMRFQLDDRLANSMRSGDTIVRVTYFNSRSPKFVVETPASNLAVNGGATGTWKTIELAVPADEFAGNSGADITLRAQTDVTFHMVEVVRDGPAAASSVTAPPKQPDLIGVN